MVTATSLAAHTLSMIKDVKRKSPTIARSISSTLYCIAVSKRAEMCSKTIGLVSFVNFSSHTNEAAEHLP